MTFSQIIADWKFWSVVVSFSALLLSQLPPIHILIRKAKLDLEVHSRIFITHRIGNPNLQLHLILRNMGGRSLRIKNISASLSRDAQHLMQLPAQSYVANPKENQLVLLTSFDLKPDDEWSHAVSFLKFFDRNDEKTHRDAELALKNEIHRQKEEFGEKHFAVASPEFIKPFEDLFDKKFKWLAGEYSLKVSIVTNTPKANILKQYRFTIFESQTESLINHKEGYPSGAGIYWDSPAYVGQWIEIEEKNG